MIVWAFLRAHPEVSCYLYSTVDCRSKLVPGLLLVGRVGSGWGNVEILSVILVAAVELSKHCKQFVCIERVEKELVALVLETQERGKGSRFTAQQLVLRLDSGSFILPQAWVTRCN
jgi:hypothetical protein